MSCPFLLISESPCPEGLFSLRDGEAMCLLEFSINWKEADFQKEPDELPHESVVKTSNAQTLLHLFGLSYNSSVFLSGFSPVFSS